MKHHLIGFLVFIFISSCVRSMYPITNNENELIFKKELLGNWKVIKEKGKVSEDYGREISYKVDTLKGSNGKCYQITNIVTDSDFVESDTSYLLAILVKIGDNYFLDCSPDTSRTNFKQLDNASNDLLLNLHVISKIKILDPNTISNSYLNQDELDSLIDEKKISIQHVSFYGDDILLEEPESLKQKLLEPGGLITLFSNEETLKRQYLK